MNDFETNGDDSAAALTAAMLSEESARHAAQAERSEPTVFDTESLPGVGAEVMTLKEGIAKGGLATFIILLVLNSLDELELAALTVLAPDIRDTFGVSDGTIVFISSASASFFVLGAMPMGYLADRFKRAPIIGIASLFFGFFVFMSGLAVNAFMLFWTRFGVGVAKSNTITVHSSLIADTYPIGVRGRMGALNTMVGRAIGVASPVLVGGIAALAGGVEGWRWSYLLLGIPVGIFALLSFRIPEPVRGRWEKEDVLGAVHEDPDPVPISIEAAFARLWKIRTMKTVVVAFAAMGFALFTAPVLRNLYLEEHFGLDAFGRGVVETLSGVGIIVAVPFVGKRFDTLYRADPSKALATLGMLLLPVSVLIPIQYYMPNVALFTAVGVFVNLLSGSAFAMVGPIIQGIVPYRLRGLGTALLTLYIFFVGATGGGLLSALMSNAYGPRTTVVAIAVPAMLIGGLMILNGARFIKDDLSLVVAELREEKEEIERQAENPDDIPVIQVNEVDFAYGHVQVLFDVSFEVRRGEVLALLGTNGAGKSTILRLVAGLTTPERGVVRLNGRTITFASAERRNSLGIHMLAGGDGVFSDMTIADNITMAAWPYRSDKAEMQRRVDRAWRLFPELEERSNERADLLSGGQQQMLALAMTLIHDPEILIIDELSIGLAPTVVQRLLVIIDELKREGMTMIIVEQSLNVALAVADRAVFLEKGRVRFEGDAQELAERDDLARAVFLGSEGG
jgi:ABC-type branched-subunit amino acid transport system ATPase component/predicted MFS family arabinose efflux permease